MAYPANKNKQLNVFIQLEGEAIGTRFEATDDTRKTMSTYIKGDEWMIFTDHTTGQQHWDYVSGYYRPCFCSGI